MDSQYQISIDDTLHDPGNVFSGPDCNAYEGNSSDLLRSSSLTSLDFMIKGERMVSELCNIVAEFPPVEINTSQDTVEKRDYSTARFIEIQQLNTAPQNVQKYHKASQTIHAPEGSRTLLNNYEMYDETIPLQIIHLAVEACTVAENIAVTNKYRPCFKNIQTICEKTRSNVQQPDSAVAQLHSQGVPWVIKNFIFAFVRILDGWKGIKELMCEKHESFVKIEKKYYNPQIQQCFLKWQFLTKQMLDHIYKTFKSLDEGFKAEQQAFKKNINYTIIQNRIKLQTKPQMNNSSSFPQYYEPSIQWNNVYNQPTPYISHEMQMAAKWSTNTALTNSIPPIKSSFGSAAQINSNNLYQSNSSNSLCENKELFNENDLKVINGMGDSSNAMFQQQYMSRNNQIGFTNQSKLLHNAICKNEFNTLSMTTKQNYENSGLRVVSKTPEAITALDRSSNITDYQLRRSCLNEPTVHDQFGKINQFNCDSAMNNYNWGNTSNLYSAQMASSSAESVCGIPIKGGPDQIYMKPGRYNIPIKVTEMKSSVMTQDQSTVETMVIVNSELATVQNSIPLTNSALHTTNDVPFGERIQKIDSNMYPYNFDLKVDEINPSHVTDEQWEAAKGSIPELINNMSIHKTHTIHDGFHQNLSAANIKPLFAGVQGAKINTGIDNIEPATENCSILAPKYFENRLNQTDKAICDNVLSTSHHGQLNMNRNILDKPIQRMPNKNNSILDSAFETSVIVKKFKKKNKLSTVKHFGNKKKDLFSDGLKRMEYILNSILTMELSLKVNIDLNICQASHYQAIIQNPITFNDVSNKMCNLTQYTIDLFENDIRKIFLDAFTYLEIYPDSVLKMKIEKIFKYFEDLIVKDECHDVGVSLKDNDICCTKNISKKIEQKHI